MAKFLCLFVVLVNVSIIQCYVKQALKSPPAPMAGFIPEKMAGKWYYQARVISCNWSGSKRFTDFARQYDYRDNAFYTKSTYRSGPGCVHVSDKRAMSPDNCAILTTSDNLGNLYSQTNIITCTDYKRYLIYWGCLKYNLSNPNKCEDPSLTVQTRHPHPSPDVYKIIDKKLHDIFGLKLADLDRTYHKNGNLYSQTNIITCTDYKRYLIYWGCLKYNLSNPNKCEDPSLTVQTRLPHPSPDVYKIIDKKLHDIFGLKLADLDRTYHKNAC